ncbi:MAG: TIGR03663 family protein, partial [Caldilineaceae bacterium]|nr:TIGR03663 family protein [Caldilineaceae bacterium]
SDLIRVDWETIAWAVLMVVAAVTRFYNLGARAMSHDESLHTLYSYYLYNAGNYEHNPMMHGPFLFHANALMYALFGDSDATARLVPALFGMGVIWMAYLFRRYVGRTGALMIGILITISPSLLFHSRYIRNDIYIALFTMIWIYGAFRYLDTRRTRWVVVMVLGMAFGFIAKENHFMTGAIMGAFFVGLGLWQVIRRDLFLVIAPLILATALAYWFHVRDQDPYALVALAVAAAIALVLFVLAMRGHAWRAFRHNVYLDLAVIMLTMVMPFTAPFGHVILGWDAMAYSTRTDILRSALLVGIVTLLAVIIAYVWFAMRPAPVAEGDADEGDEAEVDVVSIDAITFGLWARLMAIFWTVEILFFTTFFTNTRNGLATGIVGSLGYWLKQQEVARGGQPWYYYIMLGGLYEFLPLLLTGAGIAAIVYWLWRDPRWDPVPAGDLPDAVTRETSVPGASDTLTARYLDNRIYFAVLGIWWTLGAWSAYTIAGEKMPWLMTHLALPMCVVGGWYLGRLIRRVDWTAAWQARTVWLMALTPALLFTLVIVLTTMPSFGREQAAVAGVTQWLLALVILAGVGSLTWWLLRAGGWRDGVRLLALGGVALLMLLTVRFAFMLTFINYDYATEYLVYAHASPDVKRALDEIDMISERTVGERNIEVAYDDDSAWPFSWYMRQYPNARFYGANPNSDAMSAPVIIVGPENYDKVHPYVVRDYIKRSYRLIWWPDQGYFNWTPQRAWETLTDPQKLRNLFQVVFYRRYPEIANNNEFRDLTQWPNRHEFEMWVRRDIAEEIWDLGVTPATAPATDGEALLRAREIDLSAEQVYNDVYDGLPLATPRAVAVGQDGTRYIADSGNHRIVVLAPDGTFVRALGSFCELSTGNGCVDPDGAGPLETGDGQFNEPWGVAVDDAGQVYVADTWNGRIHVFDADGTFVRKWGYFNGTNGELGDPYALFGPRGIAVDGQGNLLVADTGNKRILQFTPAGELVNQVGGGGVILGRFEEPTDVAVDPRDGAIYVADAWNQRIQKLGPDLAALAEWPTYSWESTDRYHKPYLAVDGQGRVYASDPSMYRVFVYAPDGQLQATFGNFGPELNRFGLPNGLAIDPTTDQLLVADADNQRVMLFPIIN